MSNGNGSTRRPMQIPPEEFEKRWAETFGLYWGQMSEEELSTLMDEAFGPPSCALDVATEGGAEVSFTAAEALEFVANLKRDAR